ncbi:hypothetical protein [Desulfatibacillum aliphaticivorans]|uniref:hypothetical protein n=1 Tax=Desulfatibacillum aliphaticivorans TaxID=218208 RepID=UPI0004282AC7|nr:hypothetical protein [Desulfatibacillum aliphaticivorans]
MANNPHQSESQPKENIFTLLERAERRPMTFVRNESIYELEQYIHGYYAALRAHGIIENVPSMDTHFWHWLMYRTGYGSCVGWAYDIEQSAGEDEKPLDLFFFFVNEYKKLVPVVKSRVELKGRHNPAGKKVLIGGTDLMEKPQSIEIVQYSPAPIHFLRFYYEHKIENDDLLPKDLDSYETTIETGKYWVQDEFQVDVNEWTDL